ncbi:hypothetical protein [Nioella sp.]|uniref:hypothetical protein n=1 Tax=Nioella sp. TaxID=1912091 RepID=UPI003A8859CB
MQLRGEVSVRVNETELVWSNGRKIESARFVEANPTSMTFVDGVSVYVAYGYSLVTETGFSEFNVLRVVRMFYNSAQVQTSILECEP